MFHVLLLGAESACVLHSSSFLRRFDAVSGAHRGDQALALIARRPIHVIATPERLEDMSGAVFAASVRRWHPRRRPRLVLVNTKESFRDLGKVRNLFDAVIKIGSDPTQMSEALFTVASSAMQSLRFADELRGTFDELDFASLVQVVARGEKTGRLVVRAGRYEGCLLFRHGLVIHATSCGLDGRDAFRFLLADLSRRSPSTFNFEPLLPEALMSVQPMIECHVEGLLLDAA